jgi:voltage-gated potassium channel
VRCGAVKWGLGLEMRTSAGISRGVLDLPMPKAVRGLVGLVGCLNFLYPLKITKVPEGVMIAANEAQTAGRRYAQIGVQLLSWLQFLNNVLLIPMFTIMVLETSTGTALAQLDFGIPNLIFCILFFVEWLTGLLLATDRRRFLRNGHNLVDLISSIPLGYFLQGFRALRVLRILRVLKLAFRARRLRGKGSRLVRVAGVVAATAFAGALALRIVEPGATEGFFDAMWWSIVTLSTVGYGDITPSTVEGRLVGIALIGVGVGVFGYMAGFMASVFDDPEEDELLASVQRIEFQLMELTRRLDGTTTTTPAS